MRNFNILTIMLLFTGTMMFAIGIWGSIDLSQPLDHWIVHTWRVNASLCASSLYLLALHFLNDEKILDLRERIEKLEEKNEGDMSE